MVGIQEKWTENKLESFDFKIRKGRKKLLPGQSKTSIVPIKPNKRPPMKTRSPVADEIILLLKTILESFWASFLTIG
jgi:hypothetical protein